MSETAKAMRQRYDQLRGKGQSHEEALGGVRREADRAVQLAVADILGKPHPGRDPIELDLAIEDFRAKALRLPRAGVIMALADFPNECESQELDSVVLDVTAIHYVALADLMLDAALKRWPKDEIDRRRDVEAARRALGFDVRINN